MSEDPNDRIDDLAEAVTSLAGSLSKLIDRVEKLEIHVEDHRALAGSRTRMRAMRMAESDTFRQWLCEIAEKAGIPKDQIVPRYQAAAQWHYDRRLTQFGDKAPGLVAQADTRTPDQIPTSESAPKILPHE